MPLTGQLGSSHVAQEHLRDTTQLLLLTRDLKSLLLEFNLLRKQNLRKEATDFLHLPLLNQANNKRGQLLNQATVTTTRANNKHPLCWSSTFSSCTSRLSRCRTRAYFICASCALRAILLAYHRVYIPRGILFYIYFRISSHRAWSPRIVHARVFYTACKAQVLCPVLSIFTRC